jgi:hypothetical protein
VKPARARKEDRVLTETNILKGVDSGLIAQASMVPRKSVASGMTGKRKDEGKSANSECDGGEQKNGE